MATEDEEQQRIKFEKIIALLLKKLNDPFTQSEQIVDRMSLMFGTVNKDPKFPDLTVAILLARLGRITKKLQRLEASVGKDKGGRERENRRTINLKDKDQISRDGARTETVLQLFLEKSDALITKMEEHTYNFNAGLTRLDVDIPPANTIRNMSQKRIMQLVISRIGQLNGTLARIENALVDSFLELASRADPEKTGLAAEDAELRARAAPSPVLPVTLHDARWALLVAATYVLRTERAGEQPSLVEAVRKGARSSAEWATTKSAKVLQADVEDIAAVPHTRRSGKRPSIRSGPQVPPRPANLKLDPNRRSGKNLSLNPDNINNSGTRSARSASSANNDAIRQPAPSPRHTSRKTPRSKEKEREGGSGKRHSDHNHERSAHHSSSGHAHSGSGHNNEHTHAHGRVPKEDSSPAVVAPAPAPAPMEKREAVPVAAAAPLVVQPPAPEHADQAPVKEKGCCIVQ